MPPKAVRTGEYIETENGNKISRRAQLHATQHIILAGKSVIQAEVVIRGDLVRPATATAQSAASHGTTSTSTNAASSTTAAAAAAAAGGTAATAAAAPQPQTVSIHLGRYVYISQGCILHPPSRMTVVSSPSPSSSGTTTTLSPSTPTSTLSPLSAQSQTSQSQTQILTHLPLRISSHVYLGPGTSCSAASIGSHVLIGSHCVIGNMVIIKDNVRVLDNSVLGAGSVWRSGVVVGGRPARVVGEVGEGWAQGAEGAAGGGGVGGGGMEGWTRELWAQAGNKASVGAGRR